MGTQQRAFPSNRVTDFIFKNATIRGYSADWSVPHFGRGMKHLFEWVVDGTIKTRITEYPR